MDDKLMQAIEAIIRRGNDAEIRRKGGYIYDSNGRYEVFRGDLFEYCKGCFGSKRILQRKRVQRESN